MQEIGRAGRDGDLSNAVLYYNASDISSNRVNLKAEMKEYVQLKTCRRQFLCEHFGYNKPIVDNQHCVKRHHACCDICQLSCECDECADNVIRNTVYPCAETVEENCISKTVLDTTKQLLSAYFQTENENFQLRDMYTGLSKGLVEEIARSPGKWTCEHNLKCAYPQLEDTYVTNIFAILSHVKSS